MLNMPAFCLKCGNIFPSGFVVKNSSISYDGCTAGPCPKCGSTGRIPDGTFKVIGHTIEVLKAPQTTIEQLNLFIKILKEVKEVGASSDTLQTKVRTEIPELSSITDLFPKTRQDFYSVIAIIIAIISIIITLKSGPTIQNQFNTTEILNNVYINQTTNNYTFSRGNKAGRNDPCPCGSGKKYKKCCGGINSSATP